MIGSKTNAKEFVSFIAYFGTRLEARQRRLERRAGVPLSPVTFVRKELWSSFALVMAAFSLLSHPEYTFSESRSTRVESIETDGSL